MNDVRGTVSDPGRPYVLPDIMCKLGLSTDPPCRGPHGRGGGVTGQGIDTPSDLVEEPVRCP